MTTLAPNCWRRFLPVWAAGALGVLALGLQEPPATLLEQAPHLRQLPAAGLKALLLVNPLLIMTALAAIGAALAHRVGLHSRLSGQPDADLAPTQALLAGLGVAVVLAVADAALAGSLGDEWRRAAAQAQAAPPWPALAIGLLYGGLAEEVMMRWGVMSLVAWALWRLAQRSSAEATRPSPRVMWAAIGLSALVFALAHLPAVAQMAPLSPALVARTVALNALGGIVYGWLFWRRGLESAMLAHASTHVGLALARSVT